MEITFEKISFTSLTPRRTTHTKYVTAPPAQQAKSLIISADSFNTEAKILTTTAIAAVAKRIFKTQKINIHI